MVARERRGAKSPLAKRADWWLTGVFACTALMVLLAVAALLHWPVPWWIYAPIFSFCLVMPLLGCLAIPRRLAEMSARRSPILRGEMRDATENAGPRDA